jgi:catechol 2,3-dioxygenase-like lactoylglutathione lyase family enzyme
MGAGLRINHMSLHVRDLARSAQFYHNVLLLPEIECGARKGNIRWFGVGEGQSVHLIEGDPGHTFVTRRTHFCVSAVDFDATISRFRSDGVAFCDLAGTEGKLQVRADGVRSVYMQDPDGYWIEVNEDF